jgi:hypothetical protein
MREAIGVQQGKLQFNGHVSSIAHVYNMLVLSRSDRR